MPDSANRPSGRGSFRSRHRPVVYGTRHMAAAGHHLAAEAAFAILEGGGNAVDAGVAAIMTLAVVQPDMVNVAGVAPIMIHLAASGETVTISGLGRWPALASAEYFQRAHGGVVPEGLLRSVVPAAPDAWITALERYGTLGFGEVAAAAIRAAGEGFATHQFLSDRIKEYEARYRVHPTTAAIYLPGGRPPEPGERFLQSDLAASLQYMADEEAAALGGGRLAGLAAARAAFYRGDIARRIVAFHEENGGLLRMADLAAFRVGIEKPVSATFRDLEVRACGPWCQGPVLPQLLKLLEGFDLEAMGHNSPAYVHTLAEAIKLVFADRERHYGDPEVVPVPIEGLLSEGYADVRRTLLDPERACPRMPPAGDPLAPAALAARQLPEPAASPLPDPLAEPPLADTSYACVVDRQGNVFSATPSDPSWDGVVVPGTGLTPSTRGSQSRADPHHPASVSPGKRPRLTPNPAILFRGGRPILPIGTPGGDAQAQSMLQVILNVFLFGMDVQSAVEAPRFMSQSFPNSFAPHPYYPGRLNLEPRMGLALGEALAAKGHVVYWWPDWYWRLGSVCTILIDREAGILQAGADPRHESYAVGW